MDKEQENKFEGLLPGMPASMSSKQDVDHRKQMKKLLKESSQDEENDINSFGDVEKLIGSVVREIGHTLPVMSSEPIDIPQEQIDGLYALAHSLYSSGKYDDSCNLFRLLVMIDPFEYKYTFGLAACLQMEKKYLDSATAYLMAASIETTNPMPHYHAAECYLNMRDPGSACISLGLAIDTAATQEKYLSLKERCQLTRDRLKKVIRKKIKEKKMKKLKMTREKIKNQNLVLQEEE
jgi:type III secretion system low calcium response chaperone LcrH/SycD